MPANPISRAADNMQTDWRSIYVLTIVGFLGSFKMAATASGLWAYMKLMDPTVTESFYGALTSGANACNVLMSLVAGYVCNRLSDTKLCMVLGKMLWILAVFAFLAVELVPQHMGVAIACMEMVFGLSMGLMSVSRTHIAMASSEADRPRAVSIMSTAFMVGLAVGPAIMMALTLLGYPGYALPLLGLHFNLYTAPMYLVLLTTIVSIGLLLFYFDGRMRTDELKKASLRLAKCAELGGKDMNKDNNTKKHHRRFRTSYDKLAVFICCLTRVVQSVSMTFMIAVGGPYMMTAFGWSSATLVKANSVMHTVVGVLGVSVSCLYVFRIAQRYISERRAIILGIGSKLVYLLLTYPYPFLGSTIQYEVLDGNGSVVKPGCSARFDWCAHTAAVNVYVYCVALVVCFGLGFPLLVVNLDTLYSRVLGPIKQGTMQGVFLISGECLTVVGPLVYAKVYELTGPTYIWQFNICTIGSTLILWLVFYERMISATRRAENKQMKATVRMASVQPVLMDDTGHKVSQVI